MDCPVCSKRPTELSPREYDVYKLVIKGLTNKEIGQKLFVAEKTIKFHLTKIYKKKSVKNRHQLIARVCGGEQ